MPASQAKKKLGTGELLALDVRPTAEFSAGHIPGARNLPLEDMGTGASIPKDRPVLVYDRTSARSREAARKLLESGFEVSELSGGLAGWAAMKYPVEVK
jgi:rhodanese-related sulfurtransferase